MTGYFNTDSVVIYGSCRCVTIPHRGAIPLGKANRVIEPQTVINYLWNTISATNGR